MFKRTHLIASESLHYFPFINLPVLVTSIKTKMRKRGVVENWLKQQSMVLYKDENCHLEDSKRKTINPA